ncbi:MAG: hypothetical protein Kow00121_59500 [Elainellaceae cyanobacterium]
MVKYTLLVNRLLEQVGQLPEFEQWQEKGSISKEPVKKLCAVLKEHHTEFQGLPSRFYTSATLMVAYTFESWLALQQRRWRKIDGKRRWLKRIEDDIELAKVTDFSPEMIQLRAKEILAEIRPSNPIEPEPAASSDNGLDEAEDCQEEEINQPKSLFSCLFDLYDSTEDTLALRAIVHLLKNDGEVNEEPEDPEKLALRLAAKREEIQRLEKQLQSRLPTGRDPTGENTIQFLEAAVKLPEHSTCYQPWFLLNAFYCYALSSMPYIQYGVYLLNAILNEVRIVESEFITWRDTIAEHLADAAKQPNYLPYPLIFGSTSDLVWESELKGKGPSSPPISGTLEQLGAKPSRKRPSKRKRKRLRTRSDERITVRFHGMSQYHFKIYCDRRQLPIFRQFLTDYCTHKALDEENRFSMGLFALRSASLIWKKDKPRPPKRSSSDSVEPLPLWQTHRLYLHCSIDSRLLTAEGTEQVRLQKIAETKRKLEGAKNREQEILRQKSERQFTELEQQNLDNELKKQRQNVARNQTSLNRLHNSTPPRPSRVRYQGNPNIVLGISFCRQQLVGVGVVDLQTQQVLEYYSVRRLLINHKVTKAKRGRSILQLKLEKYRLVNQLRILKKKNTTQRTQQQKQGRCIQSSNESNRGQYLERLIADRIMEVALKHQAGSIVTPQLGDIRESIESAVQARAKQLFENYREKQKAYAKQFRMDFHRWSYGRLTDCIHSCARREGILIQTGRQPIEGNLVSKALKLALTGQNLV